MLSVGLDIDNTITKAPVFFSKLTKWIKNDGGSVHIISNRSPFRYVIDETKEELKELKIEYDSLYLLPEINGNNKRYPFDEMNEYQKYLWQKVEYCVKHNIDYYFDDGDQEIYLFTKYAPEINVFKVCNRMNVSLG